MTYGNFESDSRAELFSLCSGLSWDGGSLYVRYMCDYAGVALLSFYEMYDRNNLREERIEDT